MPRLTNKLPKYCKHANGRATSASAGAATTAAPTGTKESKAEYRRLLAE